MHRHNKKVNDLTLSYIDEGKGEVILLIHGFCGSPAYWEMLIPELSKTYRVIAPALRGHGKSSAVSNPYQIEDMAIDINYLLEELGIAKVYMFGHSLGGYVTLSFAEQFPEKIVGLGLIHSTSSSDSDEAKQGRMKSVALICENGIEPLIKNLIPKLFAPEHLKSMEDEVATILEIGLNTSVIGAKGALLAMRDRNDRSEFLRTTKLPTLLLAGEFDQIIPKERIFTEESPTIKHVVLENSGHMGMIEEPEILSKIMLGFINDIRRP